MESWGAVPLTGVAGNGDVTQLFPLWASVGVNPFGTPDQGDQVRRPSEGFCYKLQIETDGVNGGLLQLYDISGLDIGVDVSSATVITDAQLDAAIASGDAKPIYEKSFVSAHDGAPENYGGFGFIKGLAARFVGTGSCKLNLGIRGGFVFTTVAGGA